MHQYAILDPAGIVVGLADSEEEPDFAGHSSRKLAVRLSCMPIAPYVGAVPLCPIDAIEWRDDRTIDEIRAVRIEELRSDCQARIFAGFSSNALGVLHTYPANITDQSNLIASVTDSLMPGTPPEWSTTFWCSDGTGAWDMRAHTAGQIQQAGRDGKAAILDALTTNEALRRQVMQAQSAEEVAAIGWPDV